MNTSTAAQAAPVPGLGERVLRRVVEVPVVVLILLEAAILFSGVISRYAFHNPIGWTDELAGVLFLRIGMLGAAIAFLRSEHMRLTFVLERMKPEAPASAETPGSGRCRAARLFRSRAAGRPPPGRRDSLALDRIPVVATSTETT